jgi:hypothetical protein
MTEASATVIGATKPFQIKAGKPFAVTSSVHGVKKGDRLALEAYYAFTKKVKPAWHVLGSWPMKAGQTSFRGVALAGHPGLFTLRLQFVRGGKLLAKSESNSFQLKVLSFTVPKLRKPSTTSATPGAIADAPGVTLSGWTNVECANPLTVGRGVIVPSPIASGLSGQEEVEQVVWARDAVPGGSYGAWYIASVNPQYITQPQPDVFQIVEDADAETVVSNQLTEETIDYSNQTSDEYHQFAWDLEIQKADGTWVWASPTAWYTPESYVQWDPTQTVKFQSPYCVTYYAAGAF